MELSGGRQRCTSRRGRQCHSVLIVGVKGGCDAGQAMQRRLAALIHGDGLRVAAKRVILPDYSLRRPSFYRTPSDLVIPPQCREPFLIQVFFGGKLSNEELLNLLLHEKKIAEESLLTYDAVHQAATAQPGSINDPRAFFLSMLTLEYGVKSNRALLEWLNSAIERIETNNYSPGKN